MLKDLGRRLAVSAILITAVVFLVVYSQSGYFRYVVGALVAALAGVAAWEYGQFAKVKGGRPKSPALIALSAVVTFAFLFQGPSAPMRMVPPIVFLLAFLVLFGVHFKEKAGAVVDLAVSSFGLLYIAVPLGMMLGILYFPMQEDGRMWLAYLLVVTKITDMGAYFAGSLWGRRKLAPLISPGKTVEGAIFGLLCAVLASFAFYLIGEELPSLSFHLTMAEWVSLGVILGCIGQFGDLSESLLKRDANKKDSNALPGLGGMLDAVDSLLFCAPIVYFYLIASRNL